MNEPGELIADALREIADQAATPRPMADAAWRAGHRRQRLSVIVTSAAVAAVITIAAAVWLGPVAGPGTGTGPHPASAPGHHGSPEGPPPPTPPVSLHTPIQFEQVASTSDRRCAAGAGQVPGTAPAACVHLTGTGMTITAVRSARVQRSVSGGYALDVRLTPGDSRVFAALTRELAGLRSPRNRFAVIVGRRVVTLPTVQMPITAGEVQVIGFTSRAQAESIIRGPSR